MSSKTTIIQSNTEKEIKDLWSTPDWIFKFAEHYFSNGEAFDLDVCALAHNTKVKDNFITPEQDTLKVDWNGKYCWCNPPYSNPKPFVEKVITESNKGKNVVMLLNVDNSTKWFELCCQNAKKIVFLTGGRVAFINGKTGLETKGNSKGQMLVYFSPNSINESGKIETDYVDLKTIKEKFNK